GSDIYAIVYDITDRKFAEQKYLNLNRSQKQLLTLLHRLFAY
ncbi:MAG: hypothetical protein ACI936_000979, partial [Paraglaciecola sp.]